LLEKEVGNQVEINTKAPDFSLHDYVGRQICLSDFHAEKHVVLVFNRGFQ